MSSPCDEVSRSRRCRQRVAGWLACGSALAVWLASCQTSVGPGLYKTRAIALDIDDDGWLDFAAGATGLCFGSANGFSECGHVRIGNRDPLVSRTLFGTASSGTASSVALVAQWDHHEEAGLRAFRVVVEEAPRRFAPMPGPKILSCCEFPAAIGDLDGDGLDDVVTGPEAHVYLNRGDARFEQAGAVSGPAEGTTHFRMVLADMDGDGHLDIVADWSTSERGTENREWRRGSYPGDQFGVVILHGDGAGAFGTGSTVETPRFEDFAVIDLNGDGQLDVVTVEIAGHSPYHVKQGPGQLRTYFGSEAEGLRKGPVSEVGMDPVHVIAHDIDQDGTMDLLTANFWDHTVSIMIGDGTGRFSRTDVKVSERPSGVAVADWDKDGILDLGVYGSKSGLEILRGRGKLRFKHVQFVP